MKTCHKLMAGLLLAVLAVGSAFGATTVISDNYDVTTSGTGFGLGAGVNTGITPPTTRLTGSAASNLRYYFTVTSGGKAASSYDINSNRLRVSTDANIGRFTLSANGSVPFDFSPALGAIYATPDNPATYDIKISMRNDATSTARFSFALATVEGDTSVWDFGLQLWRATTSDQFYQIQKRIDTGSSGLGGDQNLTITTTAANTYKTLINFLIRVTDAGAESGANYHSRVQVSTNNGTSFFYDTSTDASLTSGFRFDGTQRYILFDQAGNSSGPVYYDSLSISSTYAPPPPPQRTWTGAGTDANWSTVANWDGIVPANGDPVVFNGTTQPVNTNDLSGLSVSSLTFNNGGFTLYGNAFTNNIVISNLAGINVLAAEQAWDTTGIKTWSIASGSELVLNNVNTIEVNGDHNMYGGGTLRLKGAMNIGQATTANPPFVVNEGQYIVDGGSFISRGGYRIGSVATAAAGAQTVLTNGAILNVTAASGNIRVGDSANPVTSRLVIDHSTLTTGGATLAIPYATGATGIVSQVGGTISGCPLSFGVLGAALGAYTNQNGTLEVPVISEGAAGVLSYMYFDNAILRAPLGATTAYMSGLNRVEIQSGGLTIETFSDIVIAQNLIGAGALTKSGYSALTLNGNNTYAGSTFLNAGKLVLPTGKTYAGLLQVADGAELGVTVQTVGTTLTNGSLSLGGGSLSTLSFDLGIFSTPTTPLIKVASLSANGIVNINVANGLQLTTGQVVLVDYDGTIGGALGFDSFVLANVPSGVTAELVNNTANSSIDLKITGVPALLWTGAVSSDWDLSTANWVNQQTGSPSTYSDGNVAAFMDGATTGIVNLAIYPYPSSIIVSNNALPYVWTGTAITTSLVRKNGPGSITRVDGEGDTIAGIELNAGSYVVSNLYDATFLTVLTDTSAGTGTFVKRGLSQLTVLSTNSTYDGTVLIQEGTVKINHDRSLGSASARITVADGATLDVNDFQPGFAPVTVSGAGVAGQGAIIDSAVSGSVDANLRDVTMTGDTVLGAPTGTRWDLRVRSGTGAGPGLRGNGYKLTKVGPGFVSIACQRSLGAATPYWRMNLGDILVSQGTLAFAESLDLGNPSASLTVSPGAKLQFYDLGLTNPIYRTINMTDATLTASGTSADTNVLNGSMQVAGAIGFFADQAHLIVNGAIGGAGSITFGANDPGTLILNGINTYTGDTTVTNGTLGGNGVIAGNLLMLGGTNSPGWDGIGTLTVNGNATLGGTTRMELNRGLSPNSDRLVVGGTLAFGGTLQLVLLATPQPGDVYQVFNKGSSGVFTTLILPSLSGYPGAMSWDMSNLLLNGSIKVNGTLAPPTIGSAALSGGNFTFSGTGGVQGNTYSVVTSPNVAAPLASWTPVASNVFGSGGSFTFTTNLVGGAPAAFFRLRVP